MNGVTGGKSAVTCVAMLLWAAVSLTQCNGTRAAIATKLQQSFHPSPDLRTAGAPIAIPPPNAPQKPPSARLATYLSDRPDVVNIPAFSLATAQTGRAAGLYRTLNPQALLATYFSSLRYDTGIPSGSPHSYVRWMDGHEQDFVHIGDPGMLAGAGSSATCTWTWEPDARGPSQYRVFDARGHLLATVPAGAQPQFSSANPSGQRVYVDSVLGGQDVWYTSIDNATGKRRPTSCAQADGNQPLLLHARFSLAPNPHPIFPSPTPPPGSTVTIWGSVDEAGGSAHPSLQWLYHPTADTTPNSVALVGGPVHWRVPDGVTFQSSSKHWYGSPALRYCDDRGRCTDWWTSNENNRSAWGEYNSHTNFLNACSTTENADAVRMLLHIRGIIGNSAFELDNILSKLADARPEIFRTQNPQMPSDDDLLRCVGIQWPRYALEHLHANGILSILNGGPHGAAFYGDGRIYEDVPWSAGLAMPYPFTLDGWRKEMQWILDDLNARKIVWMIPTGDQVPDELGARVREYSFAIYELLNPYPMTGSPGLYYGFSQIDETLFPEMFTDLGRPVIARPRNLAELYNARDGMYEREYSGATVYVCPPGDDDCKPIEVQTRRYFSQASAQALGRGGTRSFVPVNGVTLHPGQGAILTHSPN